MLKQLFKGQIRFNAHSTHLILYKNRSIFEIPSGIDFTYEDARIFARPDGTVFCFMAKHYITSSSKTEFVCLHLNPFTKTVYREKTFNIKGGSLTHQKNWTIFLEEDDTFLIIPYLNPLTIYRWRFKTDVFTCVKINARVVLPYKHLRGGTPLVKIGTKLVGIGHVKDTWKGYTHAVFVINHATLALESVSNPFIFSKTVMKFDYPVLIEFASGLAQIDSNTIRITFGVFNEKACYVDCSVKYLLELGQTNNIMNITPKKIRL